MTKRSKQKKFNPQDVVLKWVAKIEDKGKHDKFENLWKETYKISVYHGNNTFIFQEMDVQLYAGGHVNGRFLKHYIS